MFICKNAFQALIFGMCYLTMKIIWFWTFFSSTISNSFELSFCCCGGVWLWECWGFLSVCVFDCDFFKFLLLIQIKIHIYCNWHGSYLNLALSDSLSSLSWWIISHILNFAGCSPMVSFNRFLFPYFFLQTSGYVQSLDYIQVCLFFYKNTCWVVKYRHQEWLYTLRTKKFCVFLCNRV